MADSSSSSSTKNAIPSELRRMELFDSALVDFATHTGAGLTIGFLASLVLFRPGKSRMFLVGLCGGWGAGIAYQKSSFKFDKEILKYTSNSKNV